MKTAAFLTILLSICTTPLFAQVQRNPILEVYTGTWCAFCPDKESYIETILANYPDTIVVEVHDGDVMQTPEGHGIAFGFNPSFPQASIDHFKFAAEDSVTVSRSDWLDRVGDRVSTTSPVAVNLSRVLWNPGTREMTVRVTARFASAVSGNLRFNLYVVEDNVTGDEDYDQTNNYNNSAGHPYFGAGNPIAGYVHRNVVREIAGGPWGTSNVIPDEVGAGQSFSHEYTYTLPADYDETQVKLVGVVQRYNGNIEQREILNAVEAPLLVSKVDGLIGKNSNRLKGNNIYNTNGAGQKHRAATDRRKSVFVFSVENDGFENGDLTTRTRRRVRGMKVLYRQIGVGNVTAQLTRGLVQPDIAPGSRALFKAIIKRKTKDRIRQNLFFQATSERDTDRVVAKVLFR
ncbi:MAG: hypothetical protein CMO55_12390 [Verrucomicrobiales bacterium]|nr:hypothetical protein [Verrucomicrobiales bacterium]